MTSSRLGKRKRESKKDDEEDSSSAEDVQPARPVPVSGLATTTERPTKRRRKNEAERLGPIPESLQLAEVEEDIDSRSGRASRSNNMYATKDRRTARQKGGRAPKPKRPDYVPIKDKNGNKVWRGERKSLTWFRNVTDAMAESRDDGCQLERSTKCTGEADAIDHVKDFASEQTGLETTDICDGRHHWRAIMLDKAKRLYNGGFGPDDELTGEDLAGTFAWSCTSCNSKKSGVKGLDGGQARWLGECPGEDCEF